MPEPTTVSSTTLAAIFIALFGPFAGQYALIVFASLAGGLWMLGRRRPTSRTNGALFLIRVVAAAILLTGSIAYFLEEHWHFPAIRALAPVAFFIGFIGEGWQDVALSLIDFFKSLIHSKSPVCREEHEHE